MKPKSEEARSIKRNKGRTEILPVRPFSVATWLTNSPDKSTITKATIVRKYSFNTNDHQVDSDTDGLIKSRLVGNISEGAHNKMATNNITIYLEI